MYLAGTGRGDITAFVKGVGMLGYGIHYNTMEGVETSLTARAFVLADSKSGKKICYVNCELCFITLALKKGVLKGLERQHPEYGYDEDNLIITAQHTHSGPGGYSYYGLYNLSIPGFVIEVYRKIVDGIITAIVNAEKTIKPAKLFIGTGVFAPEKEVAFQRSIEAYNLNPEVTEKITFETRHLALDREMTLLKVTTEDGEEMGSINWFGVHPTSLPNTNHKVCYDNKGYASAYTEEHFREKGVPNYLSVFAQGTCGDVTPRFVYHPIYPFGRGQWEGKYPDDFESAKFNGKLQSEKAIEIAESPDLTPVEGEIDGELMFVNFSDITCDPRFANGRKDAQTGPAALGIAFFTGTKIDGPGIPPIVGKLLALLSRLVKWFEKFRTNFSNEEYKKLIRRKYKAQGNKDIMIESNARRVFGTKHIDRLPIPGWADPAIATIKYFYKKVGLLKKPWTPKILPLQLVILGDVAIAAFPFEITTIAGKRLRQSLLETLSQRGITRIILSPYANSYSGYITTYEEYQAQIYEGGHTVFGEWTLAAIQTKFEVLAKQLLKPKEERTIPHDVIPPDFTEEELSHFPFYRRAWYIRQELIRSRRMERRGIPLDPIE